MKVFNLNKRRAQILHDQGQILSSEGKDQDAIDAYLKALQLDPDKPESYYNIGLIYKYQGDWVKSLKYNAKAYELDPQDESTRWNLAIAATALREWVIVRSAWKDNGITLDGESGPIDMYFGMTPVRLNPASSGEVVWATRIDPVRARIDSVPYRESGFTYGDIVLHDGAAVGYRKVRDKEYPVFNVLELFESSDFTTATATVEIASEDDLKVLEEVFSNSQHIFEDWTRSIRTICRQCSEGKPHDHHDDDLAKQWSSNRTLGIAVFKGEPVSPLFDRWQQLTSGKLVELDE